MAKPRETNRFFAHTDDGKTHDIIEYVQENTLSYRTDEGWTVRRLDRRNFEIDTPTGPRRAWVLHEEAE